LSRPSARTALFAIVLFALASRLVDLDWDDGHAFHPDERAVAFAVERLSFQPLQLDPQFFAYGSLPFYLIRGAASLAARFTPSGSLDFAGLVLVGRTLSALWGVLTVLALYRLGSALHGRQAGLLAAFLLSACVLHVQHSHFMTAEALLALLCLLTLATCVRLARYGRRLDAALAGAGVGLALATKISAAPLLAPLSVAILARLARERKVGPALLRVALALSALAAAFALGQPYAFLDSDSYLRSLAEQGAMVRSAGSLPYTIQYVGAARYAYDLGQMVLWGMGPPLGIAALWAAGRTGFRLAQDRSAETAVLVAWVLPYVLVTGWFEVKFIRYLLPVYPVLILWAAAWLWNERGAGFGRWRLGLVAGGTLLAALAFLAVYRGPHTVVSASQWLYRNAPAGSTILTPHWDEGFPLPLPEGQPDQYRVVSVPYYDPDTPEKLESLARELARADYVAFPTTRIPGAITGVPGRYPVTDRFLRRLFAGELGFRRVLEETARPRLLGLEATDELADESFTVYDHPKAVVFARSESLPVEELRSRLESRAPGLPSRTEVLLGSDAGRSWLGLTWARRPVRSSLLGLFFFAAVVELLGLAAWAVLRGFLPRLGGEAAARTLGLLALGFPAWWLAHLLPGSFAGPVLALLLGLLVAVGWRRWPWPRPRWGTEALFWGSFALFALLRAWNPAIHWGEKPMDFAFLNTLTRVTSLPPPEPWFAGEPLQYTYFGHFLVAALGKLCGLHPGLTYNLGIALWGALCVSAAYALGCAAGGRRRFGVLAALLTALVGNLSGPLELARRGSLDFDYFWATSRVVPGAITEYPLWSLVFADLHAHVLALPISLTFLALAAWWARGRLRRSPAAGLGLMGLALGSVLVTSAWSGPTYLLLLPFLLACFAVAGPGGPGRKLSAVLRKALGPSLIVSTLALVLYAPFWLRYRAPQGGWGWERDASVSASAFALVFGLPLFVGVSFLAAHAARLLKAATSAERRTMRLAWVATGAVGLALGSALPGAAPPLSARTALVVAALLATLLALRPELTARDRTASVLLAFACFVTAGTDVVHVWDRMNTVFKFYLDAWLLFAAAAALALPSLWRGLLPGGPLRTAWRIAALGLGAAACFTGLTGVAASFGIQRVPTPRPTLDGTAYLEKREPLEAAAQEWLNASVDGTPVLAEAWGESYGEFSRVSMNTGLPIPLGWEYHVYQRGRSWPEIEERKADLARLFGAESEGVARDMVEKLGVALVYVGGLERRAYGESVGDRLARFGDLLAPAYVNAGVLVFEVKRREGARLPAAKPVVAPQGPPSPAVGAFRQPRGVAVDAEGQVYVADFDNNRVQKLTRALEPLAAWGGEGAGPGLFRQPCEVAVLGDELLVADTWNGRVQVLDREGRFLRELATGLYGPRGIATGPDGTVYVADTGNHRVRRFNRDGTDAGGFGGPGSAPGQFLEPIGIAVSDDARVYVCDNGNARLQAFDAAGGFQGAFPVPGWRVEVYSEPKVALAGGLVWVTVPLADEVRAYSPDGRLRRTIVGGRSPNAPFGKPLGIAYNPTTRELLVTELEDRVSRIRLDEGVSRP
jgi:YYY domain-containing protein